MIDKQFTTDWFSHNIPNWTHVLEQFKNKPNLNFLEIGCWEGRATCWLLENILTDKSSKITVVDTFKGSSEETGMKELNLTEILTRFKHNTSAYQDQITINQGYSFTVLKQLSLESQFDFAYIDASHTAYGTLEDAILTHPLIKPGGIIIFDDYLWKDPNRTSPTDSPELGIDCFYNVYADFYEVIFSGYQIGLLKKK
jgi:predicted O-methyltransferase YrrM